MDVPVIACCYVVPVLTRTVSARTKQSRTYDQGLELGVGLGEYETALDELTRYDLNWRRDNDDNDDED